MADEVLEIIKRGETNLTISLYRSAAGLTVSVKAHPVIETLMRGLGNGEQVDTRLSGPYWRPVHSDGPLLRVYNIGNDTFPVFMLDGGGSCSMTRVGMPLLEPRTAPDGRMQNSVNLSFLRLVGISEGTGVVFNVRGVHTYEALTKMKDQLGEAYKQFYRMYMKPVQMDIVVSTQETLV